MRLYLPATLSELDARTAAGDLVARRAHAVTPALRAMFPGEDDEGLEFAAQLAAADDALLRLAAEPTPVPLRLVVTVDVADALVRSTDDDDAPPSAVELIGVVPWAAVAAVHVDEPAAATDVLAVLREQDGAVERLDERDLLWYDVTELDGIPRR